MYQRRRGAPLLLNALLIVGVALLAWRKLKSGAGSERLFGELVVAFYLVWVVYEGRISLRDAARGSTIQDRYTVEFYALAQGATVLSALWLPSIRPGSPQCWMLGGAVLLACGAALRISAIRELGGFYSHRVQLTQGHHIVQTGPYRYLRHPAYAGMLLAHSGFVACFFNWPSLGILLLALAPAILARIFVEERCLAQVSGYAEFCHGRPRLIPFVF